MSAALTVAMLGPILAAAPPDAGATKAPPITALAFSPDGHSIVAGSQAGLSVRASDDAAREIRSIETRLANVHAIAFSPSGDVFAVAGGSPGESGRVEIHRWPGGGVSLELDAHEDSVYDVAWSPSGARLATAGYDGVARVFAMPGGERVASFTGHSRPVLTVAWLDETRIASASLDQSIRLWNPSTGELERALDQHTGGVIAIAARPASDSDAAPWLASVAADQTLRFWQPSIGRLVRFARLPSAPLAVIWDRKGERAIVASRDGQVRVVDSASVAIVAGRVAFDGPAYAVARSPISDLVAAGGEDGRLSLIDDLFEDEEP